MSTCEFHQVENSEANQAIEFCTKAIPHNELIGRVIRNMYQRIQTLENETASLKRELKAQKLEKNQPGGSVSCSHL
jgi:hypothetical protein